MNHIVATRRLAIVLAVWLASLASPVGPEPLLVAAGPALQDLAGITQLQSAFDADRGNVRVILLLSPT